MIDFKDVVKIYAGETILNGVSFRINPGDRVGVVGPNGAGKSTLFGIISGAIEPDKGTVSLPKNSRLGLLRQHLPAEEGKRSLLDFVADAIPELRSMEEELHHLEQELCDGENNDKITSHLERHGWLQSQIEHLGAYRLRADGERALSNLGFRTEDFENSLSSFSGGWQMRAALARVLISHPDILLLDEPSNYLDVPAVEWLCKFLKSFPGTLLLISHDRFLLRKLTRTTLEVNSGVVTRYSGGYDFYREERENRLRTLEAAKRNTDRRREHLERTIDRFRAKSSKASQAKSWQKVLDRLEEVELPDALHYHGAIRFPEPPPGGVEAARFEKVCFSYVPGKEILRDVELTIDAGDKLAFIGYNGMGKTTLLKLLTGKLKPTSGRVVLGHHSIIGYQAQEFADLLAPEQTVYDIVRGNLPLGASTAGLMNVLGSFGFSGDATEKPCKVLSGGEKIRLLFARIFVNPPNFLVLDEPTTHLDISARELLQEALRTYRGTVCVVSHDIEFIRNVATGIIVMEPPGIRKYFGGYDYYLEKSSEVHEPDEVVIKPEPTTGAPMLARERRRARAQARGELATRKKQAERDVANLEKNMEILAEREKELLEQLSVPGEKDYAGLNRELYDIQYKIAKTEQDWEEATLKLEEVLRENERISREIV